MAAVFRTLVSVQEPIAPKPKQKTTSDGASMASRAATPLSPSTMETPSSKKKFGLFRRRMDRKKHQEDEKQQKRSFTTPDMSSKQRPRADTPQSTGTTISPDTATGSGLGISTASSPEQVASSLAPEVPRSDSPTLGRPPQEPLAPQALRPDSPTLGAPQVHRSDSPTLATPPREPATSPPMYFNHPLPAVSARDALQRVNRRESYVLEIQRLARTDPSPPPPGGREKMAAEEEEEGEPRSCFESSSDEDGEVGIAKRMKKSLSSIKVSGMLKSPSLPGGVGGGRWGGSGSGGGGGAEMGVSESEKRRRRRSPVIGLPTDLGSGGMGDSAGFHIGVGVKDRLRGSPSVRELREGDWEKAAAVSPTPQRPGDAEGNTSDGLRGRTPADLARAQRRQLAQLSTIDERPATPTPGPRDALDDDQRSIRAPSYSSSFYLDDAEPDALPAPLNVVKTRMRQLGQRLRTSKSQTSLEEPTTNKRLTKLQTASTGDLNLDMSTLLDDAPPVPPLPATAPLPQRQFPPRSRELERQIQEFFAPSTPTLASPAAAAAAAVEPAPTLLRKVDRASYGLEPFELATKGDMRHPNHPLKWTTENLMCFSKHSAIYPTTLSDDSDTASSSSSSSSSITEIAEITQDSPASSARNTSLVLSAPACALCGRHCCHYINLLHLLSLPTSSPAAKHTDIEAEQQRLNASTQVLRLRQDFPNGVDVYETLLTCGECGNVVCPRCARRCGDGGGLCGVVGCVGCGGCGYGHGEG